MKPGQLATRKNWTKKPWTEYRGELRYGQRRREYGSLLSSLGAGIVQSTQAVSPAVVLVAVVEEAGK